MGLDMYAYRASQANSEYDDNHEIACWRKHPNLHGWMERLWEEKGRPGLDPNDEHEMFNGIELELTWEEVDRLEKDIIAGNLPGTSGFFFGSDADDYYKQYDLEFCKNAKADLFLCQRVFYNSSW
jgi:hypothetical protein